MKTSLPKLRIKNEGTQLKIYLKIVTSHPGFTKSIFLFSDFLLTEGEDNKIQETEHTKY